MRSTRWPRRLAPLTLGLALWTSLPGVQWCAYSWEQCRSAWASALAAGAGAPACGGARTRARPATCDGARAAACPLAPESGTGAASSTACPMARETAGGIDVGGVCEPPADPPPPGERAWCVGVRADGVLTRSLAVALPVAPSHPAVAVEAPRPAIGPPHRLAALPVALCPGIAESHAPPLPRAPPARA